MEDIDLAVIEWQAPEYSHKEKSADFLWTIGIVTVVGVVLAVWFANYLFAVFIFISGLCLIMFSIRAPQNISFSIESDGLHIGKVVHPWISIKGFDIKKKSSSPNEDGSYGKLMIFTSKYFLPIYTILLPTGIIEEVEENLSKVIKKIDIEESRSMLFMEKLGF